MSKEFAIIMCALNASATVRDSILSLEPLRDSAHLCFVDDGSTDDTLHIAVQSAEDLGLTYTAKKLDKNVGVPTARNIASEFVDSKYLIIHDSDDICLENRFENLSSSMQEVDILGGWALKINSANEEIGIMDYPPAACKDIVRMLSSSWLNPFIDPSTCIRRDLFKKLNGYTQEAKWRHVQDLEFWHRASVASARMANQQIPLIKYRENSLGVTGTKKMEMIKRHGELMLKYAPLHLRRLHSL